MIIYRASEAYDVILYYIMLISYVYMYVYYIHGCTNLPEAIPTRTQ